MVAALVQPDLMQRLSRPRAIGAADRRRMPSSTFSSAVR